MESSKTRKRKSPKGPQFIEVEEVDLSPDCSEDEVQEPEAKVKKTRNSDVSESRVSSSSPNLNIEKKLAVIKKTFQKTEEELLNEKNDTSVGAHVEIKKTVQGDNVTLTPVKDKTSKKLKPKRVLKGVIKKSKQSPRKTEKKPKQQQEQDSDVSKLEQSSTKTSVAVNPLEDGEVSDSTQDKVDYFKPVEPVEKDSDSTNQPDITITFKNSLISDCYKVKILRYLEKFVELNIETHEDNTMHISIDPSLDPSEWHVVDAETVTEICNSPQESKPTLTLDLSLCENKPIVTTPKKKKKKNDKKKNKNKDLFILDSTPTPEVQGNQNPQYFTKFLINDNEDKEQEANNKPGPGSVCFNCEKNHSLKDCPEPKNMGRINANRQKFMINKSNKTASRYHVEEDQKYAHLVPGKISAALRKALGLRKNQIPKLFYQMRIKGYPPGWLEEAKIEQSNLSMFDIHGNDVINANSKSLRGLDSDKVIEYPGFNVPFEKGVKDEFKSHRVPPYSEDCSKEKMIEYFENEFNKKLDDFKTLDMEIEEKSSDKSDAENDKLEQTDIDLTLNDLEKEKQKLLQRLDNDDSNSRSSSDHKNDKDKEEVLKCEEKSKGVDLTNNNETSEKVEKTIDKGGEKVDFIKENAEKSGVEKPVEKNDLPQANDGNHDTHSNSEIVVESAVEVKITENAISNELTDIGTTPTHSTPTTNKIRDSTFGTPILKSASPYSSLPNQDNFSKDISPVINFENLPNSTGKYEKMTGVLQKVRNTLKHLSHCKS